MRVAILSDIHGNLHALEAVLEAVDAASVDETWCLGDVVGYGADPGGCCRGVRERAAACLAGNHDLAIAGRLSLEDFAGAAADAARWSRGVLGEEDLGWLADLPTSGERGGVALFHGSPRDTVWEYLTSSPSAALSFDAFPEQIALVGHTHVALAFRERHGEVRGATVPGGDHVRLGEERWILNPGSVGQPRDGDPRAAWLVLDLSQGIAAWQRTDYDIAGAQAAIRAAGLPALLADRLEEGR
jgi:diadenosine tetraphosphatase ApaH/serine/threonine PP2A family protein phosphatase